jgi:transcriptional regulator with XRE-family HTH domain
MSKTYRTELERVLEQQGRRQDWLAKQTGIHESTISRIVRGRQRPHQASRVKIAQALARDDSDELFAVLSTID